MKNYLLDFGEDYDHTFDLSRSRVIPIVMLAIMVLTVTIALL